MSDDYISWEDLVEPEHDALLKQGTLENSTLENERPKSRQLTELLDMDDVPDEVKELIRHGVGLEKKVKSYVSGQQDSDPDSEREKLRYTVTIHTKESRIDERRLKHKDEVAAYRKKRVLEKLLQERNFELTRQQMRLDEQESTRLEKLIEARYERDLLHKKHREKQKKQMFDKLQHFNKKKKEQLLHENKMRNLIEQRRLSIRLEQQDERNNKVLCEKIIAERSLENNLKKRDQQRKRIAIEKIMEKQSETKKWEQKRDNLYI